MRRMKDRPGSQRSLKALFSSLPGPFAVALKVITLQNSLAVIARQQACTSYHTITHAVSFLIEAVCLTKSMMSCTHSTQSGKCNIDCQVQLSSEAAHVSSSLRVCCLHNGHQSYGHRHRHRQSQPPMPRWESKRQCEVEVYLDVRPPQQGVGNSSKPQSLSVVGMSHVVQHHLSGHAVDCEAQSQPASDNQREDTNPDCDLHPSNRWVTLMHSHLAT